MRANLWDNFAVPQRGWRCISVDDQGPGSYETCQMCGYKEVRFIHTMAHDAHPPLRVGCICAERMSNDYVNPRARQHALVLRAGRRSRWLVRQWQTRAYDTNCQRLFTKSGGYKLAIWCCRDRFYVLLNSKPIGRHYVELGAAKIAAFEALEAARGTTAIKQRRYL